MTANSSERTYLLYKSDLLHFYPLLFAFLYFKTFEVRLLFPSKTMFEKKTKKHLMECIDIFPANISF